MIYHLHTHSMITHCCSPFDVGVEQGVFVADRFCYGLGLVHSKHFEVYVRSRIPTKSSMPAMPKLREYDRLQNASVQVRVAS